MSQRLISVPAYSVLLTSILFSSISFCVVAGDSSFQVTLPQSSTVSPVFIQGKLITPLGATHTLNAAAAAQSFPLEFLSSADFYGNAPLSPESPTTIALTHSDGSVVSGSIAWSATVLTGKNWSSEQIRIRINDRLLMSAGNLQQTGVVKLNLLDPSLTLVATYSVTPGSKLPIKFDKAGAFIVEALLGNESLGSILVTVVSVDLHGPIPCQINFTRDLDVVVTPPAETERVHFSAAEPARLRVVRDAANPALLKIRPLALQDSLLVARLSPNGPILGTELVRAFQMTSLNRHSVGFVIRSDGYGRGILRVRVTPRIVIDNDRPATPAQEGLYFDVSLRGTGAFFTDTGNQRLRLHSISQDGEGILSIPVTIAPRGRISCYDVKATQLNSTYTVGSTPLNNPKCVIQAREGFYLQREMTDEVEREQRPNLTVLTEEESEPCATEPGEEPPKRKQIFQVWDHDDRLDGRWTKDIKVNSYAVKDLEVAFFNPVVIKDPIPNRWFTCLVEPAGSFAARMLPAGVGIRGGKSIDDNQGIDRDEALYERNRNYLRWIDKLPSAYPAVNVPPNFWNYEYDGQSKGHQSWDTPFAASSKIYTDLGFFKGNMIGKMDVWMTCSPVVKPTDRGTVQPNVRPGLPDDPHTHRKTTVSASKWEAGEEILLRELISVGRLEADGLNLPKATSSTPPEDRSSRDRFPDVVPANVRVVTEEEPADPENPKKYIRTRHEGKKGTAEPAPVQITFRAAPGEKVKVAVSIATRNEDGDASAGEDGKKTHKAWLHLRNDIILEYRGQPEDSDDEKAKKVYEITVDDEGKIESEKEAERIVTFDLTADANWFASKVVYVYGIETSKALDDLKLVVWGEEIVQWKAKEITSQNHHNQNIELASELPVKRWYVTDEEPLNVLNVAIVSIEDDDSADLGMQSQAGLEASLKAADPAIEIPADFRFPNGLGGGQKLPPRSGIRAMVPTFVDKVKLLTKRPKVPDLEEKTVYWWYEIADGTEPKLEKQDPELENVPKTGDATHKLSGVWLILPTDLKEAGCYRVHAAIKFGKELIEVKTDDFHVIAGRAANLKVTVRGRAFNLVKDYQPTARPELPKILSAATSDDQRRQVLDFEATDAWGNPVREGTKIQFHYRPEPKSFLGKVAGLWNHSARATVNRNDTNIATDSSGKAKLVITAGQAANDKVGGTSNVFIGTRIDNIANFMGDPVLALKVSAVGANLNPATNVGSLRARVTTANGDPLKDVPVTWITTKGSLRAQGAAGWVYGTVKMTTDASGLTGVLEFTNKYFKEGTATENEFIRPALGPFNISIKVGHNVEKVYTNEYKLPQEERPVVHANDPFLVANSPAIQQVNFARIQYNNNGTASWQPNDSAKFQKNGVITSLARADWGAAKTAFRFANPKDDELFQAQEGKMARYFASKWEFSANDPERKEHASTDGDVLFGQHRLTSGGGGFGTVNSGGVAYNFITEQTTFSPVRQPRNRADNAYVGMWEESNSFQMNYVNRVRSFTGSGISLVDFTDPRVTAGLSGVRMQIILDRNLFQPTDTIYFNLSRGNGGGTGMTTTTRSAAVPHVGRDEVLDLRWQYVVSFVEPNYDKKVIKFVPYFKNLSTGRAAAVPSVSITVNNGDLEEWPLPTYSFNNGLFDSLEGGPANPAHSFNSGLDMSRVVNNAAGVNGSIALIDAASPAAPEFGGNVRKQEVKVDAFGLYDDSHFQPHRAGGQVIGWDNVQQVPPGADPTSAVWQNKIIKARMRTSRVTVITDTYPVTYKQVAGEMGGFVKGFFWEADDRFVSSEVGDFIGGMLVVGDATRVVKQIARMVAGDADNPPDYIELTFSAVGVILAVIPGPGTAANGVMKGFLKTIKSEMALKALAAGAVKNLVLSYAIESSAKVIIQAVLILIEDEDENGTVAPGIPPEVEKY